MSPNVFKFPTRPKTKLKKWNIRIEHISSAIASKGHITTPKEKKDFLKVLEAYMKARDLLCQKIEDGSCTWYGRGMGHANKFCFYARDAWGKGLLISIEASAREVRLGSFLPRRTQPEPGPSVVVRVPTASSVTDSSSEVVSSNVNLEDDEEDDSGSDSNSIMAPEEVEAVYYLWHTSEMPLAEQPEQLEQTGFNLNSISLYSTN